MNVKGQQEGGLHPVIRSHGNVADAVAPEEPGTAYQSLLELPSASQM